MRSWRFEMTSDAVTSADPEPTSTATAEPAPESPPRGERSVPPKPVRQVIFDMIRSLGVVAVIVAVTLIFVPNLIHPGKSSKVQPANYSDDAVGFRQVAGSPAYTPVGLPSGWYANAATFSRAKSVAHLHIGWVTPDKKYAALEESNGPATAFIAKTLGKGSESGSGRELVSGRSWTIRTSNRGERSLTATLAGVTIVITGSASSAQEQQLAGALQPDRSGITSS